MDDKKHKQIKRNVALIIRERLSGLRKSDQMTIAKGQVIITRILNGNVKVVK